MMQFLWHITCSCIIMHCTSFFSSFMCLIFCCVSLFLSFSLDLVTFLWHLKSRFRPRTRSLVVVLLLLLLLLLLIESGFVMRIPKKISLRNFMTERFIQNARSFGLIFQTLLFPVHLALEVGIIFVRNPRVVLVCSYKSSTPKCMPSIPLFLSLLRYSKEYVS